MVVYSSIGWLERAAVVGFRQTFLFTSGAKGISAGISAIV